MLINGTVQALIDEVDIEQTLIEHGQQAPLLTVIRAALDTPELNSLDNYLRTRSHALVYKSSKQKKDRKIVVEFEIRCMDKAQPK